MKLTNQEFVKLLSEHLSSDEENASAHLTKMVEEFNKSVEKGEDYTIKGLGNFFLEDGLVQFSPTEEFSTEINHHYEGMQPVDVDAALVVDADIEKPKKSKKTVKKDIIIVDEAVEGEEDPFGIDSDEPSVLNTSKTVSEDDENMDESPEEDISQIFSTEDTSSYDEKKEEIVSKEEFAEPLLNFNTKNTDKTEDETEDIFDFIGIKLDENQPPLENPSEEIEIEETLEPAMEESAEPEFAEDPFESEETAEAEEAEDAQPEEAGPRIIKLSEHKKSQLNYAGIFKLLGLAALLLLMVGGGWWVYNQYFGAHSGPSASQNIVLPSPPPAPTTTQPTTTATTQPATTATSDDVYGLRGATRDIQGFVYAIIVHSLPSQNAANAECDKIVATGLRCIVREATRPNGGTTYRVGIGQFPTMGAAQEQVSSLEEPFRSRNFVARVN